MSKVVLYVAADCEPCEEVRKAVNEGRTNEPCDLVDVQTDEGFDRFTREVLSKGDGEVPSAYRDGQACEILMDTDDGRIIFDCPAAPPATPALPAAP